LALSGISTPSFFTPEGLGLGYLNEKFVGIQESENIKKGNKLSRENCPSPRGQLPEEEAKT
jgi:hypothetical protein